MEGSEHEMTRPGTQFWPWLGAALGLAIAVRVAFHVTSAPQDLPFADGFWYHTAANLLADGKGLIDPLSYTFFGKVQPSAGHPPLFVLVLGAVSWLGGTSIAAHQLTEVALDVLAVGAIGLLGREAAGDRVGVLAAFGAAIFPRFWATEGEVLSESLYALVIAVMLLLTFRFLRGPTWRAAGWLGVAIALAALTRGEALLFLPLLVVPAVLFAPEPRSGRLVLLGAAVAGTLVILAPWTIYNATRFDRPVPLTTGFGIVLAGANCDSSYSDANIGQWEIACTVPPDRNADESVRSDELRHIAFEYIRDHPGRVPTVMAARVGRLLEVYAPDPATFGPAWVVAALLVGWYLGVVLAVAGAVVARRRAIPLFPFVATLVAVVLNAALTWGTPRFRIPLDIAVVVLGAIAVDAMWAARRRVSRR